MVRNWICFLGAAIAAIGNLAYLNGHHVAGAIMLALAAAIYFAMPK